MRAFAYIRVSKLGEDSISPALASTSQPAWRPV